MAIYSYGLYSYGLSGATDTSPRVEWPLTPVGEEAGPRARHGGDAAYMAEARYKVILGDVRQAITM